MTSAVLDRPPESAGTEIKGSSREDNQRETLDDRPAGALFEKLTKRPSPERHESAFVGGDQRGVPVRGRAQGGSRGRLRNSLQALNRAAGSDDATDWQEAAFLLKREAARLRRTPLGRHAAVLLALADALTFTEPTDPALKEGASKALREGGALLTEPYISDGGERGLLHDLLSLGWNLTPTDAI
jgi:hypothetical protein